MCQMYMSSFLKNERNVTKAHGSIMLNEAECSVLNDHGKLDVTRVYRMVAQGKTHKEF